MLAHIDHRDITSQVQLQAQVYLSAELQAQVQELIQIQAQLQSQVQKEAQLQAELAAKIEMQEQTLKQLQEQQMAEQVKLDGHKVEENNGNNTSTNTSTAVTGNNYNVGTNNVIVDNTAVAALVLVILGYARGDIDSNILQKYIGELIKRDKKCGQDQRLE